MTYQLTIFGVDSGGNIMPPIVINGVKLYDVEDEIIEAKFHYQMEAIDTVLMAKEVEHGEA